jgi:drug/metabolite transporter (DMT)-like permease
MLLVTGGMALPDAYDLALMVGASLFGIAGYGALTQAMRTGQVSAVTPFRYTRIVFALTIGVLIFGERPDALTLAGSGLIVACGLTLLVYRPQR